MSSVKKIVYLVSGWKRHGKNTLCDQYNGIGEIKWNWQVYAKEKGNSYLPVFPIEQVSFAAALKKEVLEELELPPDTDTEKIKEQVIKEGRTFRDFLIKKAAEEREKDPDHWAKKLFDNHQWKGPVMVTDWRYPNEYEYVKNMKDAQVVTIRVFRSEVEIPTHPSERQLDKFCPDFLLVPMFGYIVEHKTISKILPQFKKYKESKPFFLKN